MTNHGSYTGLSVPKVKLPAFFVFIPAGVQAAAGRGPGVNCAVADVTGPVLDPADVVAAVEGVAVNVVEAVGVVAVAAAVAGVVAGVVPVTDDVGAAAPDDTVSPELVSLEPFDEDEHAAIEVRATLASTIRTSEAVRAGLRTQKRIAGVLGCRTPTVLVTHPRM